MDEGDGSCGKQMGSGERWAKDEVEERTSVVADVDGDDELLLSQVRDAVEVVWHRAET